jgi:hypothetical protein
MAYLRKVSVPHELSDLLIGQSFVALDELPESGQLVVFDVVAVLLREQVLIPPSRHIDLLRRPLFVMAGLDPAMTRMGNESSHTRPLVSYIQCFPPLATMAGKKPARGAAAKRACPFAASAGIGSAPSPIQAGAAGIEGRLGVESGHPSNG